MLEGPNFSKTTSLVLVPDGTSARIVSTGDRADISLRLGALGLVPGVRITKVAATAHRGPLVLERGGGTFALSYNLAKAILVEAPPASHL